MTSLELAAALREGRRVYGTCITSTSPQWVPAIRGAGVDFVFIDTEHIPIGRETLGWMCQAYAGAGLPPIVRIPKPDPYLACMALDAGAAGILAPYVESIDEVQALRGAVKFRPLKGARLQRVLAGEETLDAETAAYLARHNAGKLMLINIESAPAMAALDELLAVPDLDGVVIGPHDLSINLGIAEQYTQPRFTEAVTEILGKARARGIAAGYHFGFGLDTAIAWAGLGANLVIHSTDLMLVRDTLRHDLARFREALGEDAQPDPEAGGGDVPVV